MNSKNRNQKGGGQSGGNGNGRKTTSTTTKPTGRKGPEKPVTIDLTAKDITPKDAQAEKAEGAKGTAAKGQAEPKTQAKESSPSSTKSAAASATSDEAKVTEKPTEPKTAAKTENKGASTADPKKPETSPSGTSDKKASDAKDGEPKTANTGSDIDGKSAKDGGGDAKPAAAAASASAASVSSGAVPKVAPKSSETKSSEKPVPGKAESESKSDRPKAAPIAKEPPRKSGGFGSALLGAVFGGILSLAGFIGLQTFGYLPQAGEDFSADIGDIEVRLADLESAVSGQSASDPAVTDALASLETRLDEVAGLAETANSTANETAEALSNVEVSEPDTAAGDQSGEATIPQSVTDSLESIEERVAALEARPAVPALQPGETGDADSAGLVAALTALQGEIRALDAEVDNLQIVPQAEVDAIGERLSSLEAAVGDVSQTVAAISIPSLVPLQEELASISGQIGDLSTQIGSLQTETAALSDARDTAAAGLETVTGDLAALVERATGLETTIGEQSEQVEQAESAAVTAQSAARAVALANLETVVATGGSLDTALAALGDAGFAAETLAPLQPFAESGLRNNQALSAELGTLIGRAASLQEAQDVPAEEAGPIEKLFRNATSVIAIRRVDESTVSSNEPLGALRPAFEAGDVGAFETALLSLQDNQKTVFETWLSEWKAAETAKSLVANLKTAAASSGGQSEASEGETQ
ncbi:MAG: hypothetical protein AAGE61_18970 [Pseudomonadota bacterium]